MSTVLLMASSPKSRDMLPLALEEISPSLTVDTAGRITEALARIEATAYDAVVCCADTTDELAFLIRIKKARPELPVVMLTRVEERGFEPLAESMGASAVVRNLEGLPETARAVATAIETLELAREQRRHTARTKELAHEVQRLSTANRKLVSMALGLSASVEGQFYTLVVEDEPPQALLLVRALAKAGLPPFVRTVHAVDEAVDYLSGKEPYQDRRRHPFPGLVIADLALAGRSGIELLTWIRETPETRHLGFIMLTSSTRTEDAEQAFQKGANLYLAKSQRYDEIIEVVRTIYTQFVSQKTGLGTF